MSAHKRRQLLALSHLKIRAGKFIFHLYIKKLQVSNINSSAYLNSFSNLISFETFRYQSISHKTKYLTNNQLEASCNKINNRFEKFSSSYQEEQEKIFEAERLKTLQKIEQEKNDNSAAA